MKIVFLDAYTLNPGDLDWAVLNALGQTRFYDRTAPEQVVERIGDAEAVLVNKVKLNADTLAQLPTLRYIGVVATGYDIIDTEAAKRQGIAVTNVSDYSSDSVAQLTFALLLELVQHVGLHSQSVRAGDWARANDFSYHLKPLMELSGKTLGLIGLGDIGSKVAAIGRAMGMNVLVHRRKTDAKPKPGITYVSLENLLRQSDVVSLHCPATPQTKGMINANTLKQMKPGAFLLNTARGVLLNEQDVADALADGRLAGAGVDVLSVEPPHPANPLLTAPNCIITPHIAWASYEARQRLLKGVATNLLAFQEGRSENRIV